MAVMAVTAPVRCRALCDTIRSVQGGPRQCSSDKFDLPHRPYLRFTTYRLGVGVGTALQAAAAAGHLDVVGLAPQPPQSPTASLLPRAPACAQACRLLDCGADPNLQIRKGAAGMLRICESRCESLESE